MDTTAANNINNGEEYFLWFSDFHFDPHYSTSQAFAASYYRDSNCQDSNAPPLGGYGCDSPRGLVTAALEHAVNLTSSAAGASKPAFVIVSGDSIRHGVDQLFAGGDFHEGSEAKNDNSTNSTSVVDQAVNSAYHTLAMEEAGAILGDLVNMVQVAFPELEVIVSLGNNDVVPDYYLQLMEDDDDDDGEDITMLGSSSFATTLTPESAGMLGVIYNALSRQDANNSTTPLAGEQTTDNGTSKQKTILTTNDKDTFLRGGYYSRTFHNNTLTVLSLNTVLYSGYIQPAPSKKNGDDPGRQFAWMRMMLSDCRERGTEAIIVGHIPPAVGSFRHTQLWKEDYIQTYYEIVKEFDNLITAQLFGHLHSDEFRVGLADDESSSSDTTANYSMIPSMTTPILLGPSITPLHGNDPSFRLVKYDRGGSEKDHGKYRILDYDSNRFSFGTGNWSKLYTFSEAYGAASDVIKEEGLSSKAFRTIVKSMKDKRGKESPTMKIYRSLMQSGADGDLSGTRGPNVKCDSQCRDEYICTFQSATRSGYDNCVLERKHSWTKDGRSIFGLVGAVVFGIAIVAFGIARCRRRRKRNDYESTPSVTGNGQNDEIVARDQEMT